MALCSALPQPPLSHSGWSPHHLHVRRPRSRRHPRRSMTGGHGTAEIVMDIGVLGQHALNGLMLGMMYALVAVGFTLFFGVLDVIKFSHGDVLTVGAFTALVTFVGLTGIGLRSPWLELVLMLVAATGAMALLGMLIARYLVMPLRGAPPLNTL